MERIVKLLIILATLTFMTACSEEKQLEQSAELTISAAASLQDVLNELASLYRETRPEVKLNFNFGGSGALQQQITQGAPVDLFFSAAKEPFDLLVKGGYIVAEDGIDLLGNELVLVTQKNVQDAVESFVDLKNDSVKKIAIGTPDTVPAGKYAQITFEKLAILNIVQPKLIYTKDVRQVLTYVETANVDAGIVYKTDALTSDKIKIIATADVTMHEPIIYPVGIIKSTKNDDITRGFYMFLQSEEAKQVFVKYGFTIK